MKASRIGALREAISSARQLQRATVRFRSGERHDCEIFEYVIAADSTNLLFRSGSNREDRHDRASKGRANSGGLGARPR
jgi:hypothetical protein